MKKQSQKASQKIETRNYALSIEDAKALGEQYKKDKKFPNPYRNGSCYGLTIQSLVNLGINKPHPISRVHETFRKVAPADFYKNWSRKEKRNTETGLDTDGKFEQNVRVLTRTSDYALKLLQVGQKVLKSKGCVIDLDRDAKGGLLVTLNTNSADSRPAGRAPKIEVTGVRTPSGKVIPGEIKVVKATTKKQPKKATKAKAKKAA